MKWIRKGFTLVEILVSLVIVSLLVIVIFQTYKSIADISVRVDNVYKMTNEMLFAHQTIQNLVDLGQLDIDKRFEGWTVAPDGKTNTIYFKGVDGYNVKVFFDKECPYGSPQKVAGCLKLTKWLSTETESSAQEVELTNPQIVTIDEGFTFVVQPINNVPKPNGTPTGGEFFVGSVWYRDKEAIAHPGFWMYGKMRININPNRPKIFQVETPIQSFFNIRSY